MQLVKVVINSAVAEGENMNVFPAGERIHLFTLQAIAEQKGFTEEELAQFTQLVLYGSEAVTFEEGKREPEAATTVVGE